MIQFNLGRVLQAEGNLADAEATIKSVLESRRRVLGPTHEDTERTQETLAHLLQHVRKPAESAKLFQDLGDLRPENVSYACGRTLALLAADNLPGARASSARLLHDFGKTSDPNTATSVLQTYLVVPPAAEDEGMLADLADRVVGPNRERLLGATSYRMGRYPAAMEHLSKAASSGVARCWDWLFLAMTYQHLAKPDQARDYLRRAQEWIEAADAVGSDTKEPRWQDWGDRSRIRALYREAEELIQDQQAPGRPAR
jgi:tetratricopeptide (TPR) repeat protein